jgi:hypothetical protein
MNKLIKEALKDIQDWNEYRKDTDDGNLKYWLTRMYRQGYIDALEWSIKNAKNK